MDRCIRRASCQSSLRDCLASFAVIPALKCWALSPGPSGSCDSPSQQSGNAPQTLRVSTPGIMLLAAHFPTIYLRGLLMATAKTVPIESTGRTLQALLPKIAENDAVFLTVGGQVRFVVLTADEGRPGSPGHARQPPLDGVPRPLWRASPHGAAQDIGGYSFGRERKEAETPVGRRASQRQERAAYETQEMIWWRAAKALAEPVAPVRAKFRQQLVARPKDGCDGVGAARNHHGECRPR